MSQSPSPFVRHAEAEAPFHPDRMGTVELMTGTHLQCAVSAFEPGQSHEPHSHGSADQIFIVVRGRGTLTVGGTAQTVSPGVVALAPAGSTHTLLANAGERLIVLTVTSPPTGPASLFAAAPAATTAQAVAAAPTSGDTFVDGEILAVGDGEITFQADPLSEPLRLAPGSVATAALRPGPARLVIETSARSFNRTMGTARSVQTRDGVPVRFTGIVSRIDDARKLFVIDVGYPVVAHDLGGFAADSLAVGSGVMFQSEGPTRAVVAN